MKRELKCPKPASAAVPPMYTAVASACYHLHVWAILWQRRACVKRRRSDVKRRRVVQPVDGRQRSICAGAWPFAIASALLGGGVPGRCK
jgi:hypothetical protein